MTSYKLDSISIQDFRGIRRLDLALNGRNLIIVGENGSGKSSIIDALEYFFTDHVQKLRGRLDVREEWGIPHLQGAATNISIRFTGSVNQQIKSVYPKGKKNVPGQLRSFFKLAATRPFILRRAQILNFIDARPSERYAQISQLIGLEELDQIDRSWRRERDTLSKQVIELERELHSIHGRLGELLKQPIRSEQDLIRQINLELIAFGFRNISDQSEVAVRQKQLAQQGISSEKGEQLRLLEDVRRLVDGSLNHLDNLLDNYQLWLQKRIVFLEKGKILEESAFEQLLDEAYRLLKEQGPDLACPVCESPVADSAAFLSRLRERLGRLHELTLARQQLTEAAKVVENSINYLQKNITSIIEQLPTINAEQHVDNMLICLNTLEQLLGSLPTHQLMPARHIQINLNDRWRKNLALMKRTIEKKIDTLAVGEEEMARQELSNWLGRIDEHWQRLKDTRKRLRKTEGIQRQVDLVYETFLEVRRQSLQRLRRELEQDFVRLYQKLHPDEGYDAITIPVQPDKRSSVDLTAGFYGQNAAHPLNFFSEGHLDSLGLCIFLAFIKRFNGSLRLIALDDVLTTVDAGHRLCVARLLAKEFSDYQIIITTHDQLWAKELERIIPNSRLVMLKRWSLEQGADCWHDLLSDWEYYSEQALSGRPHDAIAGAGRNLEKFLYQMRGNLGLAVPAKPNRDYSIGDLYGPFLEWLNKHKIERVDWPKFQDDLQLLQAELDEIWRLRNWSGAHFNQWAETVTSTEAISFIQAVQRFVQAFECPVCCNLVVYNRTAKVLLCSNCKPTPPLLLTWEYRADWYQTAIHLLRAPKAKIKQGVVPMVQRISTCFFSDMRRRVNLPVPATSDNRYDIPQLYQPFFTWAHNHPRDDVANWSNSLSRAKAQVDRYRHGERWVNPADDEEIVQFVDAIYQLVSHFSCSTCRQLLNYDYELERYWCTVCNRSETTDSQVSAYWFVNKN